MNTANPDNNKIDDAIELLKTNGYRVTRPFEPRADKDKLKARGYRWEAERKTWTGFVPQENLPLEIEWLREHVYQSRPFKLELEKADALNRFTSRRGTTETISY